MNPTLIQNIMDGIRNHLSDSDLQKICQDAIVSEASSRGIKIPEIILRLVSVPLKRTEERKYIVLVRKFGESSVVVLLSLCFYLVVKSFLLSVLFAAIVVFLSYKFLRPRLVPAYRSAGEIAADLDGWLDAWSACATPVHASSQLDYPLDRQYRCVLTGLQFLWRYGRNNGLGEGYENHISVILDQCGYEFIHYQLGCQLDAVFHLTSSSKIDAPLTTLPAVKNIRSGLIVVEGTALIPQ